MTAGNQGCPCFNSTATFASLTERSCVIAGTGETGVLVTLGGSCVPHSYGASQCLPHDYLFDPTCRVGNASDIMPAYCVWPWCFVDADACGRHSEERMYRSSYFDIDSGVDLFYSYSTCNSTANDWFEVESDKIETDGLNGVSIRANIPTYYMPWMFKRDPMSKDVLDVPGNEYYDNTIPFEGVMIDYVDRILKVSGGDIADITYTHRTRASGNVHPVSSFTAAVQDVEDGLVDMSIGNFWITAERLKMAAFTVPLYYDKTFLVIENPETTGPWDQAIQVLTPFTVTLWMFIGAAIVLSSLIGVCFSDMSLLNVQGESRRQQRTLKAYLRLAVDSCLQKAMFFCSGGVEQDGGDTLPNKCLMVGFGCIILTCVTAYVANLAAFVTRQTIGGATTMEDAVSYGQSICAHPVIRTDLERAWPGANFVFDTSGKEYVGMLDLYEKGKCQVLAISWEAVDAKFRERLCENGLVFTTSLVNELPIGFPIRPQLAPGFSSWIVHAERINDITIQTSTDAFIYPKSPTVAGEISTCEVELTVVKHGDRYAKIGINHMALPFIFFMACVIIAIILQLVLVHQETVPGPAPLRNLLGRVSTLPGRLPMAPMRNGACPVQAGNPPHQEETDRAPAKFGTCNEEPQASDLEMVHGGLKTMHED